MFKYFFGENQKETALNKHYRVYQPVLALYQNQQYFPATIMWIDHQTKKVGIVFHGCEILGPITLSLSDIKPFPEVSGLENRKPIRYRAERSDLQNNPEVKQETHQQSQPVPTELRNQEPTTNQNTLEPDRIPSIPTLPTKQSSSSSMHEEIPPKFSDSEHHREYQPNETEDREQTMSIDNKDPASMTYTIEIVPVLPTDLLSPSKEYQSPGPLFEIKNEPKKSEENISPNNDQSLKELPPKKEDNHPNSQNDSSSSISSNTGTSYGCKICAIIGSIFGGLAILYLLFASIGYSHLDEYGRYLPNLNGFQQFSVDVYCSTIGYIVEEYDEFAGITINKKNVNGDYCSKKQVFSFGSGKSILKKKDSKPSARKGVRFIKSSKKEDNAESHKNKEKNQSETEISNANKEARKKQVEVWNKNY